MRPVSSSAFAIAALYLLHQDVWFWRTARPLVFGFLPIGLAYHAALLPGRRAADVGADDRRLAGSSRAMRTRRRRAAVMIPAVIVFAYLAVVLYIGIFAFRGARAARRGAEDYFLAGRSLGPAVFLLSLFGTNMTAFTILGSAGHAFANGILTFGLMASSSAFIIPLTLFFVGTRMWALGKRHGFMTPVQMFRDRWECGHIGTVIFAVQAALLVPYIIIGVMGGGTALARDHRRRRAVLARRRGRRAGRDELRVLRRHARHGLGQHVSDRAVPVVRRGRADRDRPRHGRLLRRDGERCSASPATAPLLTRERVSPLFFFSYTFIPLSTIAFPHITIFCLTARRHGAVQAHRHLLSAVHSRDLAAVRVPRRGGERDARRAPRSSRSSRRARRCAAAPGACRPTSARRSAGRRPATTSCS